jgi:hypothetical protein
MVRHERFENIQAPSNTSLMWSLKATCSVSTASLAPMTSAAVRFTGVEARKAEKARTRACGGVLRGITNGQYEK